MAKKAAKRPPSKFAALSADQRRILDNANLAAHAHLNGLLEVPVQVDPRMRECLAELGQAYDAVTAKVGTGAKSLRGQPQLDAQHVFEDAIMFEVSQLPRAKTREQYDASVQRAGEYMELSDTMLGARKDGWKWVDHLLP